MVRNELDADVTRLGYFRSYSQVYAWAKSFIDTGDNVKTVSPLRTRLMSSFIGACEGSHYPRSVLIRELHALLKIDHYGPCLNNAKTADVLPNGADPSLVAYYGGNYRNYAEQVDVNRRYKFTASKTQTPLIT